MHWFTTIALSLLAGFSGAALWELSGIASGPSGDETRDYLLNNPQVLTEIEQARDGQLMAEAIAPLRTELETAYPGTVLGNPEGDVTLVKFSDYACGFCRQSHEDVLALIAADPDLRVVIRDYPALSEGSVDAARMALAAAHQGKFASFHDAMFAAGSPDASSIAAAATAAGMDLAEAQARIASGMFEGPLQNSVFLAQRLGVNSTPSWVIGDQIIVGAQDAQRMSDAIATARAAQAG